MFKEINKEILEFKERLRENKKLESLRRRIEEELSKKKIQQKKLEKILEKEKKDFEKLEKLSLSSVFLSLIGKKEEKLDKEKKEYLIAKLKYDKYMKQINELENELAHTNKLLIDYKEVDKKYDELLKQKEELLIKEGSKSGHQFKNELLNMDELKVDIKEIKEAINSGETVLNSLDMMKQNLQSAKGWGTWDILGGGLISDIAKHSAINKANDIAKIAQSNLKLFKKELSDVNEFTNIQVNLSSFAYFADFFLDGIFADWFVQSKINDSLNNVNKTMKEIEAIISGLNQNLTKSEYSLKKSELEIKNILEV